MKTVRINYERGLRNSPSDIRNSLDLESTAYNFHTFSYRKIHPECAFLCSAFPVFSSVPNCEITVSVKFQSKENKRVNEHKQNSGNRKNRVIRSDRRSSNRHLFLGDFGHRVLVTFHRKSVFSTVKIPSQGEKEEDAAL